MKPLEKRIERLERLYHPEKAMTGMYFTQIQFIVKFGRKYDDPNDAPPLARWVYLQLLERFEAIQENIRKSRQTA